MAGHGLRTEKNHPPADHGQEKSADRTLNLSGHSRLMSEGDERRGSTGRGTRARTLADL